MVLEEDDGAGLTERVDAAGMEDGPDSVALIRFGSGVERDTEEVESTRGRRLEEEEEEEAAWESWLWEEALDCIPNCARGGGQPDPEPLAVNAFAWRY